METYVSMIGNHTQLYFPCHTKKKKTQKKKIPKNPQKFFAPQGEKNFGDFWGFFFFAITTENVIFFKSRFFNLKNSKKSLKIL